MSAFVHALQVLQAGSPGEKTKAARSLSANWERSKVLGSIPDSLPDTPARPETPKLVPQSGLPRRRLGSQAGRCALLHAVAHIEFNAIDLAADMICRFGPHAMIPEERRTEFVGDWIRVCDDEARHFELLNARLQSLGQTYGDHPAHNGLWQSAMDTRHDIAARLAIAPLVLEARGLDVTPAMIQKFQNVQDIESADILKNIYEDEIGHVATGAKWFHIAAEICNKAPEQYFVELVKTHFKGTLKPPFNHEAREKAGLPQSYYAYMG